MRVIVCRVGEEPTYESIGSELEDMQKIVHGYIEEFPLDDDYSIVCNEEGKLNGMKPNRLVMDVSDMTRQAEDVIFGDFFICRNGEEDFESVQDGDLLEVIDRYCLSKVAMEEE